MDRPIKIENHTSLGLLWCVGWLFTIGFLKLSFFQGVLAILIWPYYIGAHLADAPAAAPTPAVLEDVQR